MKKLLFTVSFLLLFSFVLEAQLSFKERRQLERSYNSGVEEIYNKSYVNAITAFSKCIEIDSNYAIAYLQRGRVKAELDQIEEALKDMEMAISRDRDLGEAYFYMGYFLIGSDTTGMGKEYLEVALEKGFENAEGYYFLGLTYLLEEDDDNALFFFNKAIFLKNDMAIAYHDRAGIKRRLGDYNGALYDYKTAVNYQSDFPIAYNNMGSVKIVLGDYVGAIEDFAVAIEQDPDLSLAYNNRGYANYQLGSLEDALVDFSKAIELESGFMEAKLNTASSKTKQNDYVTAMAILDEIILENPSAGVLYLNRGLVRELQGDVVGACEDWQSALDLGEEQASEYLKECK